MKTECRLKFALFAGMLITAMLAIPSESFGQASVSVYAFSAPANLPSQDTYAATFLTDVEQGMMTGSWPVGNPLNPGYATPITSGRVSVTNTIYTPSMYSWNASPNPSGAFANEHGQMLIFGAKITDSTPFTLNQVDYWLGFPSDNDTNSGTLAGLGYSQLGIGINWGPDGIPGTADDITYTSGNGSSQVNEVLIEGVTSFGITGYCPSASGGKM